MKKQVMKCRKSLVCNMIGIIDVTLVRDVISKIEMMPPDCATRVCLMINSQGGSVPVALAFAGYLRSLPHHIVAYNMAHCDSAAILIFAAAHERIAKESSSFMFHPPCVHLNGKLTLRELSAELKRLKTDTKSMIGFLSEITSLDRAHLAEWMEHGEHIYSARQALQMGIATSIEPIVGTPLCNSFSPMK